MSACYDLDSNSDASSEDASLPPPSKMRRFPNSSGFSGPISGAPVTTHESKRKMKKPVVINLKGVVKTSQGVLETENDDFVTGDTPPPAKRPVKAARNCLEVGRSGMASRALHEFMKPVGGGLNSTSTLRKSLNLNSTSSEIVSKNVRTCDFTTPLGLSKDSRRKSFVSRDNPRKVNNI